MGASFVGSRAIKSIGNSSLDPLSPSFSFEDKETWERGGRGGGRRGKRKILIRSGMRPWDVIQRKLQNPQRVRVKLNKHINEEHFFPRNCPGFRPYYFKSGITFTSVLVFFIFFLWKQVRIESQQWMKRRRDPPSPSSRPMSRKPRFPLTCEKGKNHPPFFGENGGGLVGRSVGGICFCHCGDRMRKGGFSTREMGGGFGEG